MNISMNIITLMIVWIVVLFTKTVNICDSDASIFETESYWDDDDRRIFTFSRSFQSRVPNFFHISIPRTKKGLYNMSIAKYHSWNYWSEFMICSMPQKLGHIGYHCLSHKRVNSSKENIVSVPQFWTIQTFESYECKFLYSIVIFF